VLWAFVKSDTVKVNDSGSDWIIIKEAIIKKVKDFEPQILTNVLVISTVGKDE
jgi:hypothetical protein